MAKSKKKRAPKPIPDCAAHAYNITTPSGNYSRKMPDGNTICFSEYTWYPPTDDAGAALLETEYEHSGDEFKVTRRTTRRRPGDASVIEFDPDSEIERFRPDPAEPEVDASELKEGD